MVHAYHAILSFYGFWLPNDQRGSWSDRVRKYELRKFGPATKVTTRQSLANKPFDPARRNEMRYALKYEPVQINGEQARLVASGFALACREGGHTVHACAVMPNHVHLVIRRDDRKIEKVISHLKSRATFMLNKANQCPLPRSPWARGSWVVYLNTSESIGRAIRYTNNNPVKHGMKQQHWKFVTPHQQT